MGRAGVGAGVKTEPAASQLPPAPPSVSAMVLSPTLSLGSATASPALPQLPARGSGVGGRSSLPLPPHLMRLTPPACTCLRISCKGGWGMPFMGWTLVLFARNRNPCAAVNARQRH